MRIGVIYGGFSSEWKQSKENGISIAKALREKYRDVLLIEYSKNIIEDILNNNIDFAFIAVQGKHHGDGTIQGILDLIGVPYSGTKMCAAAIMNNKITCKQIWKNYESILTPDFFTVTQRDNQRSKSWFIEQVERIGGFPVVAKPVSQGASIGIEWIKTPCDFEKVATVLTYDPKIIIEKFINSRFVTQPIITIDGKPQAFPIIEAISLYEKDEFRKYNGQYEMCIPALDNELRDSISCMSLDAFAATDGVAYARLDYAISHDDGRPYLLEINAVPGMTDTSLVPYSCAIAGINRTDLLDIIIHNS